MDTRRNFLRSLALAPFVAIPAALEATEPEGLTKNGEVKGSITIDAAGGGVTVQNCIINAPPTGPAVEIRQTEGAL